MAEASGTSPADGPHHMPRPRQELLCFVVRSRPIRHRDGRGLPGPGSVTLFLASGYGPPRRPSRAIGQGCVSRVRSRRRIAGKPSRTGASCLLFHAAKSGARLLPSARSARCEWCALRIVAPLPLAKLESTRRRCALADGAGAKHNGRYAGRGQLACIGAVAHAADVGGARLMRHRELPMPDDRRRGVVSSGSPQYGSPTVILDLSASWPQNLSR